MGFTSFFFNNIATRQDVSASVATIPANAPVVSLHQEPQEAKGSVQTHTMKHATKESKDVIIYQDQKQVIGININDHKVNEKMPSHQAKPVPTEDKIITSIHGDQANDNLKKRVDEIIGKRPNSGNGFSLAKSTSAITILEDNISSENLLDAYSRATTENQMKAWTLTESLIVQGLFSIAEGLGVYLILLYYLVNGLATLDYSSILKRQKRVPPVVQVEEPPTKMLQIYEDSNDQPNVNQNQRNDSANAVLNQSIEKPKTQSTEDVNVVSNQKKEVVKKQCEISESREKDIAENSDITHETQPIDKDSSSSIDENKLVENSKADMNVELVNAEQGSNDIARNTVIIVGSIAASLGLLGAASLAYKKHKKASF
ncbi:hypothetical protein ROZALSC1DRAFT_30694 [Rozella allomycis CSF55]|uniref:Uncharacterized protein n=1 Tax=Rozella allomycis (strain CSF55) TaxID=988480 RepID=A0A4P9YDJ7_ROZAC|nr:hypothetical protein ROZALSC1DRAFT_30694 [Rozella allomycis CSF55]